MLLLGLIIAFVGVLLTRSNEIIVHDPSDGLPGKGPSLKRAIAGARELAEDLERQARLNRLPESRGSNLGSARPLENGLSSLLNDERAAAALRLYGQRLGVELEKAGKALPRDPDEE